MTESTPDLIKLRVKRAAESSPIAIFRTGKPGIYNAVFASTYETRKQIVQSAKDFVGVFSAGTYKEFKAFLKDEEKLA